MVEFCAIAVYYILELGTLRLMFGNSGKSKPGDSVDKGDTR